MEGRARSSRGMEIKTRASPLVHPVTETKCGPWLHWHRGQSSRSHSHSHSHTPTQAHTHAYGYAARRYSALSTVISHSDARRRS